MKQLAHRSSQADVIDTDDLQRYENELCINEQVCFHLHIKTIIMIRKKKKVGPFWIYVQFFIAHKARKQGFRFCLFFVVVVVVVVFFFDSPGIKIGRARAK